MDNKKWIPIHERFPDSVLSAYFISGHSWFGIGIWENGKGWTRGFTGEWPHGDEGTIWENKPSDPDRLFDDSCLNDDVMYWREIIEYPVRGTRMEDVTPCKPPLIPPSTLIMNKISFVYINSVSCSSQ